MTEKETTVASAAVDVADTIEIKVEGQEKPLEIFMSYGLLSMLANSCIKGLNSALAYAADPFLQEQWVGLATAELDAKNRPVLPAAEESYKLPKITSAEAGRLVDWCAEHVISFLLKRIETQTQLVTRHQKPLEEMLSRIQEIQKLIPTKLTLPQPV